MIARFKQLQKGILRLIILTWIILMIILLAIFDNTDGVIVAIYATIGYWFFVRGVMWVCDGFKENE